MQHSIGELTDAEGPPATFDMSAFVEDWLNHLRDYGNRSPLTIKAYRGDANRFIDFLREHRLPTSVDEINHRHIRAFAASLSEYAPATICRKLDALSSFLGHLQRIGIVDVNPVAGVERPKRPRKVPRAATVEQTRALVAAAETPRDRAMLLLLACTGIRRGELLGLDISDVAADLSEVKVRGKGERERMLPVPAQCRDAVRYYLNERAAESPALFLNNADHRIGTTTFHRWFRGLLRRAGLEESGLTPHGLRHSYATNLLRAGVDLETIRTLMGHSDISVTGRYLSTDPSRKRSAVERLPDFAGEEVAGDAQ